MDKIFSDPAEDNNLPDAEKGAGKLDGIEQPYDHSAPPPEAKPVQVSGAGCPRCGNERTGRAQGMNHCEKCGYSW